MKKVLFLLIALMSVMCLNAQELRMPKYGFLDNWSMSVGIGANATFADKYQEIVPQNWGPEAWMSLNKDWSPVLGTRVQIGWNKTNVLTYKEGWGGTKQYIQKLKQTPNNFGASLDFTFNILNTFLYDYDRRFNIVTILGVGYSHMFDKQNLAPHTEIVDNYKKGNFIVPKIGLQLNYKVSEPVLLFLEGNFKVYSDKLDEIVNKAQYDGQMVLTAGVTYKFKNRDGSRGFKYIPSYDQRDIDALNGEINKLRQECEKAPKVVVDTVTVENIVVLKEVAPTTVRFTINSSKIADDQMANLENIATYLKDNKDVRISITGYADADTGTPEYNMELSEKRAESVKEVLVKYGVEESRLVVGAEGDKVQQYEENNWNRATIMMSIPQD